MATDSSFTIQKGIKNAAVKNITNYALFLGGPAATHEVLKSFDPLKTGWARLFMVRKPVFLENLGGDFNDKLKYFKHILEYANTGVAGIGDYTLNFQAMTGGYGGRQIQVPTHTTDGMDSFSVTVYEFSGSPIREVIDTWINGISDKMSTFTHYNGTLGQNTTSGEALTPMLANQTAEFIYVVTDNTGMNVEYACMLADATPTTIQLSPFEYTAGSHDLVQYTLQFNCVRYDSLQINQVAKKLIDKYRVLMNSLNFHSGIDLEGTDAQRSLDTLTDPATGYNPRTGHLESRSSTSTNDNNSSVFDEGLPYTD